MKTSIPSGEGASDRYSVDFAKVFFYGFLSALTFGMVPSYLHRMAPPHVAPPDTEDLPPDADPEDDFLLVAQDIANATQKVYPSQNA